MPCADNIVTGTVVYRWLRDQPPESISDVADDASCTGILGIGGCGVGSDSSFAAGTEIALFQGVSPVAIRDSADKRER